VEVGVLRMDYTSHIGGSRSILKKRKLKVWLVSMFHQRWWALKLLFSLGPLDQLMGKSEGIE
jgi:hypothetical protein